MTSGLTPPESLQAWVENVPTDAEVIATLRHSLEIEVRAIGKVIADRNQLRDAMTRVRDDAWTTRAEMRELAKVTLKGLKKP